MSGNPRLIAEVTDVSVSFLESFPPTMVVQASGRVATSGWTHPDLSRVVYVMPPADGIQDYEFIATPPSGQALDVLTPVEAEDRWHHPPKWLKGVRVKSATNTIEKAALFVTI